MEISIRNATAADYNSLCDLFDEIDALHRDNLPHIFQKPDGAARAPEFFLGLITDENIALLVADLGGELVGFIHAMVRETPAIPIFVPRRTVVVESIVVKSELQNHGIGRLLMDEMEEWAIAKAATSVELNVYEFNQTAISFYEGLGFQTLSRKMSKELKRRG